jgi:hypothetical protein
LADGHQLRTDVVAEIRDRLRSDLTTAMKTGDQIRVRVLRSALTSIENTAAVPAPRTAEGIVGYADVSRLALDRARVVEVLEAEVREREEGAVTYDSMGNTRRQPRCASRQNCSSGIWPSSESALDRHLLFEPAFGDR